MKKVLLAAVLAMFATATVVCAQEAAEKKVESKTSTVYTCDKCGKAALTAGKCCDQDMAAMKVLAVKDGSAVCCACAGDCKCALKEGDATKCACDKDIKKVSLKGMFCCDKCCVISDKEGKCAVCGGDLKAAAETKACEPKTEPAKIEAPKTEVPAAEAPKAEAPKTEAPKAEEAKPAAN